jgi:outer membrane protein, heavy metal efflux system
MCRKLLWAPLLATALALGAPVLAISQTQPKETPEELPAQGKLPLEAAVTEALEKHPAIQSASRRVQAMRHRIPQARSLPDPTVSVGWMGDATPFQVQRGDPSSYRSISAMQEIPYPGKLRLRGQIVDREAEAVWWEYEAVRRRVVADVKAAYFDYFFAQKALEITRKNRDLLQQLARAAEIRYEVGRGLQQDVFRAQVELSTLLQRIATLEQQLRTAQVRLNTLLLREPEAPLPMPEALQPLPLSQTLDELYALARQNDTGLQREDRIIERNRLAADLARRDYLPDLGVGYMYQQRPIMPDMHGFTVSVNIPVFYRSKQREAVREATEEVRAAELDRRDRQTTLFYEVKEQYLAAQAAQELLRLYSGAVMPQSSLALESSMSHYQVGTADFLTLISNFVNVLEFEVGYHRELAAYHSALARLERLVGVELTAGRSTKK